MKSIGTLVLFACQPSSEIPSATDFFPGDMQKEKDLWPPAKKLHGAPITARPSCLCMFAQSTAGKMHVGRYLFIMEKRVHLLLLGLT